MGWYDDHLDDVAGRMADRMQLFHHTEEQVMAYLLKDCKWDEDAAEVIIEKAKRLLKKREEGKAWNG